MLQTSEFSDGESTNDGSVYLETRSASDTVDVPDLVDPDAIPADLLDTGFQLVTVADFNALSAVALRLRGLSGCLPGRLCRASP